VKHGDGDQMTISALESYLDLLLAFARYGRKLSAIEH